MNMDAKLQAFLDGLPAPDRLEFLSLCESMYKIRFTGPTTIHWRNGLPKQIDLGQPIRLTICSGDVTDESERLPREREGLDSGRAARPHSPTKT